MGLPNIGPIELLLIVGIVVAVLVVLAVRRGDSARRVAAPPPPAATGPACPRCGHPTVVGAGFCGSCGQPLSGG